MRDSTGTGTHLELLIQAIEKSRGKIAELGMGYYSTPYLHYKAFIQKRELVSFENNPKFSSYFEKYKNDTHKIVLVENWNDIDLSGHWGVALIDHHPEERRVEEIKRLADSCDFIVIHDTNGRNERYFHFNTIFPLFKYRIDFTKEYPQTTLVSNFNDLKDFYV